MGLLKVQFSASDGMNLCFLWSLLTVIRLLQNPISRKKSWKFSKHDMFCKASQAPAHVAHIVGGNAQKPFLQSMKFEQGYSFYRLETEEENVSNELVTRKNYKLLGQIRPVLCFREKESWYQILWLPFGSLYACSQYLQELELEPVRSCSREHVWASNLLWYSWPWWFFMDYINPHSLFNLSQCPAVLWYHENRARSWSSFDFEISGVSDDQCTISYLSW